MPHVTITALSTTTSPTILGFVHRQTRTVKRTIAEATLEALKKRACLPHSLNIVALIVVATIAIIREHSVAQLAAKFSSTTNTTPIPQPDLVVYA